MYMAIVLVLLAVNLLLFRAFPACDPWRAELGLECNGREADAAVHGEGRRNTDH